MKSILVILALLISMPVYSANNEQAVPQQKQSKRDLFDDRSPTEKEIYRLKVLNSNLQSELRDTKRKYYAEKTKREKLETAAAQAAGPKVEQTWTRPEVQAILDQQLAEAGYQGMVYTVAEEQFLLSLTNIEDVKWLLDIMIGNNLDSIVDFKGEDETYKENIKQVIADYQSYYDSQRNPVVEQATEQSQ